MAKSGAEPAPLSQRGYARHRKASGLVGGSLQAVQRAIAEGRLTASLATVDGDVRIADPELADREWDANTDLSRAPTSVREPAGAEQRLAASGAMHAASTREKNARASLAEMELARKAGELVRADHVEKSWEEVFTQIRTAFLALPSKMKARCPDLTREQLSAMEDEIAKILELLAAPAKVAS